MSEADFMRKHSLQDAKTVAEVMEVYQNFLLDFFPNTDSTSRRNRQTYWPLWSRPYSQEELELTFSHSTTLAIPEELKELYRSLGGLKMKEGFDIDQPCSVFRVKGQHRTVTKNFQTLTESHNFETEFISDEITSYMEDNFCCFGELVIGNRAVFLIFDRDGYGFETVVQDVDDVYEEQFKNLCRPSRERKKLTLGDVINDVVYQLMGEIIENGRDEED